MEPKIVAYRSLPFTPSARLAGVIGIIVGLAMIGLTASRVLSGWNSQNWPSVQGRIIQSDVVSSDNSPSNSASYCKVNIVYAYSPPSRDQYTNAFQSSSISSQGFIDPASDSYTLEEAQRIQRQYEIGTLVKVYYNPTDPKIAFLRPGENLGTFSGILIGSIAVVLSGLLFCFASVLPDKAVSAYLSLIKIAEGRQH